MYTLNELRHQISTLRETKGRESDTLDLITRAITQAESEQAWEDLANLYLEQHLTYQHLIMNQRDSATPDQSEIDKHLQLMLESTLKAQEIVQNHNLDSLTGDIHRFLGRCYTYQQKYDLAKIEYESALDFFQAHPHPRYLEVKGFLAETFVHLNQPDIALNMAKSVYDDYETSPSSQQLKISDYRTWAI